MSSRILCLLVAILAGVAAVTGIYFAAGPNDTARDSPLWDVLRDPFVVHVAAPQVLGAAVLAWPVAVFCLLETKLRSAAPIVGSLVVVSTGVASFYLHYFGPFVGFAVGALAMAIIRVATSRWILRMLNQARSRAI